MSEELEKKQDNRETKIGNREELFEQILAISDRKLILNCARIVFECSVEDGLILMEKLKLGNEELVKIIASPSFIIKHREVFSGVAGKISPKKAQQKISANSDKKALADLIIERDKQLKKAEKAEDWEEFAEELEAERDSLPQAEVVKKITNYYAPFLKTRKFAPKDVAPDKNYPRGEEVTGLGGETRRLRSSEQVADAVLSQYALILNGAHYVTSVKNILANYLKENKLSGEPNFSADELFVTKNVIEKECERLNIPFAGVESRLKTARYTSFSAGVGRVEAEKGILKKLNEALKEKGKKAELVGDKYEIVDDEKAEKKEKKNDFEGKVLDYLEKLEINDKSVYEITKALTGIESPRADKLRRKVLEYVDFDKLTYNNFNLSYKKSEDSIKLEIMTHRIEVINKLLIGLVGLDTDEAWKIRQDFFSKLISPSVDAEGYISDYCAGEFVNSISLSLAGINSDKANDLRKKIFKMTGKDVVYFKSLAGINSDEAWQERNRFLESYAPGHEKYFLDQYLIGLDSDEAWEMRDKILERAKTVTWVNMYKSRKDDYINGLIGLESERAWQMREEMLDEISGPNDYFAKKLLDSLIGLTSQRSMEMRKKMAKKGIDIYYSLVGNDLEFICDAYHDITGMEIDVNFKNQVFLDMLAKRNELVYEMKVVEVAKKAKEQEAKEFDFAKFEEKALDFAETILLSNNGIDKSSMGFSLAGFDSKRAWEIRNILIKKGYSSEVLSGLAGLDSEKAWDLRERMLQENKLSIYFFESLAGLDSKRAWEMRDGQLRKDPENIKYVARSLVGLDTERAWKLRDELFEKGIINESLVVSLTGLDSKRAWEMREGIINARAGGKGLDHHVFGMNPYTGIGGTLIGLDSSRAWQMRERIISENNINVGDVLRGLSGLDSSRAWQMREDYKEYGDSSIIAYSIIGLNSKKAWDKRNIMLEKEKSTDYFGFPLSFKSISGGYINLVLRLGLNQKEKQELNDQLRLINLLHNPDIEGISRHFGGTKSEVEEALKRKRESGRSLAESFKFTNFLNKLINRVPQLFLNDMSAKKDRLTHLFVERLVNRIFPEIKESEDNWRGFSGYSGMGALKKQEKYNWRNYLFGGDNHDFMGGGAEELNDNREIIKFRYPLNDIIVTGIYGQYNKNLATWGRKEFSIDTPLRAPVKSITGTIIDVKNSIKVLLPKPLDSRIAMDRIKGFDTNGNEFELETKTNDLGEVEIINKPPQVEKIAYSVVMSTVPLPLEDLSQGDYGEYRKHIEIQNGRCLTEAIAILPEDLELQLAEVIKNKSPKEQVIAIERLVRDLGYYDVNNQEVNQLKSGKTLEEQLYIMEQRLEELRQTNPDSDEYKGKRFAGVCADFAKITAMLLRRAGFASGMISCFCGSEEIIRAKHAHATAFVLWPDAEGRNRVISIDGTPDGLTGISTLSLVEKEVEAIKNERELSVEAIKEVEQIIKDLNSLDVETVRKMSNGELERVLNNILKYQVKESHLAIIERLLEYYWYTPVHELDLNVKAREKEAVLELASAVERQRKRLIDQPDKDQTPAGNKLMQTMQDFLRRFEIAGATEDKDSGLRLMEKIVELVQNDLSDLEKKSAYAVIAYLKAKNILGDKS